MNYKKIVLFFSLFLFFPAFYFFKISFVLGTHKGFFSGINFILPTLGAFLGIKFATIFIPLFFIFKKITFGGALTLGIPTFISSLFFSLAIKNDANKSFLLEFEKFVLSVIIPLSCIFLFVIHPVGNQAYIYSFYWVIPILIYCLDKLLNLKNIFFISLSTTFIAHAVGSLIWLYVVGLSYVQWISLIPIVAVERLVFASGMTLGYLFISYLLNKSIILQKKYVFLKSKDLNNGFRQKS